jgi:hypothetical protein
MNARDKRRLKRTVFGMSSVSRRNNTIEWEGSGVIGFDILERVEGRLPGLGFVKENVHYEESKDGKMKSQRTMYVDQLNNLIEVQVHRRRTRKKSHCRITLTFAGAETSGFSL